MNGIKKYYEEHHHRKVDADVPSAIVTLSERGYHGPLPAR